MIYSIGFGSYNIYINSLFAPSDDRSNAYPVPSSSHPRYLMHILEAKKVLEKHIFAILLVDGTIPFQGSELS